MSDLGAIYLLDLGKSIYIPAQSRVPAHLLELEGRLLTIGVLVTAPFLTESMIILNNGADRMIMFDRRQPDLVSAQLRRAVLEER